jgi:very-short-patch-repair endonuclease
MKKMIEPIDAPNEAPVLIVVVNDPADLARAREQGWYRIPLDRAPRRVAAEYLAFYQTAAFPPEERWAVCWYAAVRGYRIASRRELIPDEPDHPRADHRYYKVTLGALEALPRPVPSRRLRRITFIPTTLGRLLEAEEINDLWIKSTAQERLWAALKQADVEAERQYPLREDLPQYVADFALLCRNGRAALIVEDEPHAESELRESPAPDYLLAAGRWTALRVRMAELEANPFGWVAELARLAEELGGVLVDWSS